MGGAWLEWNEGGYDRLADQLSSEIAEGQYVSFIQSNDGALAAERGVSSSMGDFIGVPEYHAGY